MAYAGRIGLDRANMQSLILGAVGRVASGGMSARCFGRYVGTLVSCPGWTHVPEVGRWGLGRMAAGRWQVGVCMSVLARVGSLQARGWGLEAGGKGGRLLGDWWRNICMPFSTSTFTLGACEKEDWIWRLGVVCWRLCVGRLAAVRWKLEVGGLYVQPPTHLLQSISQELVGLTWESAAAERSGVGVL